MLDFNQLSKATASWQLSAAQKQQIESYCLHAAPPAPAILLWLRRSLKPLLAAGIAAAAVLIVALLLPHFGETRPPEQIIAGAPDATPDSYYETPEGGSDALDPAPPEQNAPPQEQTDKLPEAPPQEQEPETPALEAPLGPDHQGLLPDGRRDGSANDWIRSLIFDRAQEHRFDALCNFDESKPISKEDFARYAYHCLEPSEITPASNGSYYPAERLAAFASGWFGFHYPLPEEQIFVPLKSAGQLPMTEVLRSIKKYEDGVITYTLRCAAYYYDDYQGLTAEQIRNHNTYQQRKYNILKGKPSGYSGYIIYDIKLIMSGTKIEKILRYTRYPAGKDFKLPEWPAEEKYYDPIDYKESITVINQEYKAYTFRNQDSEALLRLMDQKVHDNPSCDCSSTYAIKINGKNALNFGLGHWGSDFDYVTQNGATHDLTKQEINTIKEIFLRNLYAANRDYDKDINSNPNGMPDKSYFGNEVTVYVDGGIVDGRRATYAYTFRNQDSEALLKELEGVDFHYDSNLPAKGNLTIETKGGKAGFVLQVDEEYYCSGLKTRTQGFTKINDISAANIQALLRRNLTEAHRDPAKDLSEAES